MSYFFHKKIRRSVAFGRFFRPSVIFDVQSYSTKGVSTKSRAPEINNYRPISILPVLSKVLEKHVSDSLTLYLNENNLLHKTQSGFRPHHSCETALNFMTDSWLNAIDDGKMIGVVLVDFKKAFDLVDHDILMSKLEFYGIKENTLSWFNQVLSITETAAGLDRQYQIKIQTHNVWCSSRLNFGTASILTLH